MNTKRKNHPYSEKSQNPKAVDPMSANANPGDLVFLKKDPAAGKHKVRDMFMVTKRGFSPDEIYIQKIIHAHASVPTKLRSERLLVRQTQIYKPEMDLCRSVPAWSGHGQTIVTQPVQNVPHTLQPKGGILHKPDLEEWDPIRRMVYESSSDDDSVVMSDDDDHISVGRRSDVSRDDGDVDHLMDVIDRLEVQNEALQDDPLVEEQAEPEYVPVPAPRRAAVSAAANVSRCAAYERQVCADERRERERSRRLQTRRRSRGMDDEEEREEGQLRNDDDDTCQDLEPERFKSETREDFLDDTVLEWDDGYNELVDEDSVSELDDNVFEIQNSPISNPAPNGDCGDEPMYAERVFEKKKKSRPSKRTRERLKSKRASLDEQKRDSRSEMLRWFKKSWRRVTGGSKLHGHDGAAEAKGE